MSLNKNKDYRLLEPLFIELYNNRNISVANIRKKLGISYSEYRKLRDKCKSEGTINVRPHYRRKTPKKEPRYFSPVNRNVHHEKYGVKRQQEYFGTYNSVREAELIVKKLKECGWDKSQLNRIKKEVKEEIQ